MPSRTCEFPNKSWWKLKQCPACGFPMRPGSVTISYRYPGRVFCSFACMNQFDPDQFDPDDLLPRKKMPGDRVITKAVRYTDANPCGCEPCSFSIEEVFPGVKYEWESPEYAGKSCQWHRMAVGEHGTVVLDSDGTDPSLYVVVAKSRMGSQSGMRLSEFLVVEEDGMRGYKPQCVLTVPMSRKRDVIRLLKLKR